MALGGLFFVFAIQSGGNNIHGMTTPMPDEMFAFLVKWEGAAYENDPDDPGGATKYGIDQRSHPTVNIRTLSEEGARAIYNREWLNSCAPNLIRPLSLIYFDSQVNCGRGKAFEWLEGKPSCTAYLEKRERYYRELCEDRPRFRKYLHGWLNRTADLRKQFLS